MPVPNIPRVYDHKTNKKLAFLQNAYDIGYTIELNGLSTAQFTLPANDPKNEKCQPFNYVEIYDGTRRVELFRIAPTKLTRNERGDIKYQCEHVIATLMDDDLFKYHQIGNLGVYTPSVIRYVLDRQSVKKWELGVCEFNHQFEYKFENNKLLAALFSIPKPFIEAYYWEYKTTGSKWVLNLRKIPDKTIPDCEVRYKKNMTGLEKDTDPTLLTNRIYGLGYGEGDNQLTIEKVNGGIPYVEDLESIAIYGVKSSIFVDRRFENAAALKARIEVILKENKAIYTTYKASAADLFMITGQDYDFFDIGRIVRIVDTEDKITHKAKIIKVQKNDITGEPFAIDITIGDAPRDIASSIAELADRERINELNAQGSTCQFIVTFADNADPTHPAVLRIYIPDTVFRINRCVLNFTLEPFRAYSKSVSVSEQKIESTTEAAKQTTSTSIAVQRVETTTAAEQRTQTTSSTEQQTRTTSSTEQQARTTSSTEQQTPTTSSVAQQTPTTSSVAQQTPTTSSAAQQTPTTSSETQKTQTTSSTAQQTPTTSTTAEQSTTSSSEYLFGTTSAPDVFDVSGYGGHSHKPIINAHSHTVTIPAHSHTVTIPAHNHSVTIPAHSHTVTIPAHSHTVTIPAHSHTVTIPAHSHTVTIPAHNHTVTIPAHSHTVTIPEHKHTVTIPAHSHMVTIPAHSHTVTIPAHSHTVTIPAHGHDMEFGIYQGTTASKVTVKIDGVSFPGVGSGSRIEDFLSLDSAGKIRRNYEHIIEILPDKMTRISASIFCQIFTNSRGGGDY